MARSTHKDSALLKEELLARLRKGYGIGESCKLIRISRQTYYNWGKKDDEFAAACKRLLSDPIHSTRILQNKGQAEVPTHANWQLRFIGVYKQNGDRDEAASAAGKHPIEIRNAMDPRHADYDEAFHKSFLEEEQRRLWRIEDNTLTKAEHDMPTARFVLSNLLKEKYGKLEGAGTTQNLYWFTAVGEQKARDWLEGTFGDVTEIASQGSS